MNFVRIIFFPILLILSFFYYITINFLKKLYEKIRKSPDLDIKIICVGNYTFGGTGKTEVVKKLVKELLKLKKNVVIITKGYKRKSKEKILCLFEKNSGDILDTEIYGDEPTMLFKELQVPIVIGKKKKELINYARQHFHPEIIVSDDGYQNFTFHKDINILVVNPIKKFWNRFLFPLGNLRETVYSSIRRADFIILNHTNMVSTLEIDKLKNFFVSIKKDINIISSFYIIKNFVQYITGKIISLDNFKKQVKEIVIFSGIGFPDSLKFILEQNDFEIKKQFIFNDHHWYKKKDIEKILLFNFPILTTKKDIVKIEKIIKNMDTNLVKKIYFLDIDIKILEGQDKWEKMLNNL